MRIALLFFLFVFAIDLAGQTLPPIPDRLVTVQCANKRTDEVLRDIALQGKFEFAWDARLFDPAKPVTLNVQQITVRKAIHLIFGSTITYRIQGNYVVLIAAAPLPDLNPQVPVRNQYTISGYVVDADNYVIAYASIYDSLSLSATLSNQIGFYEIRLESSEKPVRLDVRRENYIDTFIVITPTTNVVTDVVMRRIPAPVYTAPVVIDTVASVDTIAAVRERRIQNIPILDSLIGFERLMQSRNLKEAIRRDGQVSLLPFISTNGVMGGAVSNKYSFNVVGGYTGGTSVAELGGAFNIDRGNVQWIQVAGGFNLVEGNTRGLQLSGGANINFGTMKGLQLTGGSNFLFDTLAGVQLAGGSNFIDGPVAGFQLAGGVNVATKELNGMQIAGGGNFALGEMNRMQVSAALNYARQVSGIQIAAGANVCMDTMHGAQGAILNIAKDVRGVQVGIVNYSNSYIEGVPVGLISIVVHGLHEIEIASTERGMTRVALRTGTRDFYNILDFAFDPISVGEREWMFGYGFGHRFGMHPKFDLSWDFIVNHFSRGAFSDYTSEWAQMELTAEWRPYKSFAIAAGPTFNYFVSGTRANQASEFQQAPLFIGVPVQGFHHRAWIGATFSLRFF